jgi:hypothetical protein
MGYNNIFFLNDPAVIGNHPLHLNLMGKKKKKERNNLR